MRRILWAALGVDPPLLFDSLAPAWATTPAATPDPGSALNGDGAEVSLADDEEGGLESTAAGDPSPTRLDGEHMAIFTKQDPFRSLTAA